MAVLYTKVGMVIFSVLINHNIWLGGNLLSLAGEWKGTFVAIKQITILGGVEETKDFQRESALMMYVILLLFQIVFDLFAFAFQTFNALTSPYF